MKILGITGGMGAGKSNVARCMQTLGATVIDADAISRRVLEPDGLAYAKVINAFGKEILQDDKTINRKALAEIVFQDAQKLSLLNGLVHPCVFEEMKRQMENADTDLVCLDVPLLFNCDFPIHCDKTLAVLAPLPVRIERIMKRDGLSQKEAMARIDNQLSEEEFRQKADMILVNDGEEEDLMQKVKEIYQSILEP